MAYYLIKHIDAKASDDAWNTQSDIVWWYKNELDALDAADQYNSNLAALGIPSWACFYSVGKVGR